jgi:hypothetical protein
MREEKRKKRKGKEKEKKRRNGAWPSPVCASRLTSHVYPQ